MSKADQPINITITAGTIVKLVFVAVLFYFLFILRDLVLVLLTSIVIASAVEPFAKWFINRHIPRVLAVLIVYVLVLGLLALMFVSFVPQLVNDVSTIADSFPGYIETITEKSFNNLPALGELVQNFTFDLPALELLSSLNSSVSTATIGFISTFSSIFGGLLSFLLIIVISFYLSVQDDGVSDFLRVVVPSKHEDYAVDLWKRSRKKIGLWMQGQLLLGVIVGVLTYLGLSILGVKHALFLALIAAMFELIPIFGPILSAIPAVMFALIDGGLTLGLFVVGFYIIIQQFESQLIHPLVVKKIVGIPALMAILALIIGAQIAGFLGILISVPLAAALMEFLNDVEKRKVHKLESAK
jgi:predicted PurR-regulated permease PerM